METEAKKQQRTHRQLKQRRNVCLALAQRETHGSVAHRIQQLTLPRTQWSLASVLHRDEGLVLLGFSSDGHFLLYYAWWESCYELQWRRVDFSARSGRFAPNRPVFRLPVGDTRTFAEQDDSASASTSSSLANGMGSSLIVWQSSDHALVVAFATDRALATQESAQSFHVSIAPAPIVDSGAGTASDVTSLRFVYSVQCPCQEMETWQLVQFAPLISDTSAPSANPYHLLINMGTSVMVLVLSLQKHSPASKVCGSGEDHAQKWSVSHFAQNEWYFAPEFPVEFEQETFRRKPWSHADDDDAFSIAVECICQQVFDVESFLQSFLYKYGSLRQLNLVDYDLQLVRASEAEKTLFMSCVMELESSSLALTSSTESAARSQRCMCMALFFSLDLMTGEDQIIRALKLPRQQNLRQLSKTLAKKYKRDVDTRIPPPWRSATAWNNAPAMQEQSLRYLHNPQFPVSIYLS